MPPEQTETAEKLASLKAACDDAPDGGNKSAALKSYRAAERAHIARNAALTIIEIDAAFAALGDGSGPARLSAGPSQASGGPSHFNSGPD